MNIEPQLRARAPVPLSQRWLPPGPVAAAFEASDKLNPIIIGPIGSGKTTTALRKGTVLAHRVPPNLETVNGRPMRVKRCRIVIVARTYRVMWKNLLPSYWKVFPKEWGKWTGGEGEPWVHRFRLIAGEDLILDMQFDGMGVGDTSLDDLTRGLEITGAYIYEFDTLPQETISKFLSRCGRYPNMATGEQQDQVPRQVFCDANAFDPDHWAYGECFEDVPDGRDVFVQPGGRSPNAENVQNVGREYYTKLAGALKPWETARLIDNKFVPDRPGFVVFTDYSPELHRAPIDIEPVPTLPLIIGVDPGLKSAAIVLQRLRPKVWRAIDELVTPRDEGWQAKKMGERLTDLLAQNYSNFPAIAILDPSANAQNAVVAMTWLQEFAQHFPYPLRIALSNRVKGLSGRLSAVRTVLTHIDAGEPGLVISTKCRVLLKGFNGAYRWKAKPKPNENVASDVIEDAYETHPQDALQYPIHTIEAMPELMSLAAGGAGARGALSAPAEFQIQF